MKNFEEIKKETKRALCDMRRGAVVIKDKAVELYKKRPDIVLGGAASVAIGSYMVGLCKGLIKGDEVGRNEAASDIGVMIAAHNAECGKLESEELKKVSKIYNL